MHMSTRPELLKKGDTIGLVAPSRVIEIAQVERAYKVFIEWGLEVKNGKNLFAKAGYFAGEDDDRLTDLQEMLDDPTVKCVFCARGGYGMTRIIDQLDFTKFEEHPKWIVGFSDITALHLALNKRGIESIHGLMPVQFGNDNVANSLESLKMLLFEGSGQISARFNRHNVIGIAKSEIVGGNLSLVAESLGTSSEIDTDNKILFLEEIDEYLYKIDRMLNQLKRANKFENLKGLIIGDFSLMKDTSIPFGTDIYNLIARYIENLNIPVAFDVPIGHEDYNLSVPVSSAVELSVEKDYTSIKF